MRRRYDMPSSATSMPSLASLTSQSARATASDGMGSINGAASNNGSQNTRASAERSPAKEADALKSGSKSSGVCEKPDIGRRVSLDSAIAVTVAQQQRQGKIVGDDGAKDMKDKKMIEDSKIFSTANLKTSSTEMKKGDDSGCSLKSEAASKKKLDKRNSLPKDGGRRKPLRGNVDLQNSQSDGKINERLAKDSKGSDLFKTKGHAISSNDKENHSKASSLKINNNDPKQFIRRGKSMSDMSAEVRRKKVQLQTTNDKPVPVVAGVAGSRSDCDGKSGNATADLSELAGSSLESSECSSDSKGNSRYGALMTEVCELDECEAIEETAEQHGESATVEK